MIRKIIIRKNIVGAHGIHVQYIYDHDRVRVANGSQNPKISRLRTRLYLVLGDPDLLTVYTRI